MARMNDYHKLIGFGNLVFKEIVFIESKRRN